MGILDKAKEATASATDKAKAMKEQASDAMSELKDQAAAQATRAIDAGLGQVKDGVADFNATLPIVKLAGYTLAEVSLEIGLAPKIIASFHVAQTISDEDTDRIVEEHAENRMAVLLVRALHRAAKLQESLSIAGLKPTGLSVAVGLSPVVAIRFG
jgi:hypothetical protein